MYLAGTVQVLGDTAESVFEMTNDSNGMQALSVKGAVITLVGKVTIRNMRAEGGSAMTVEGAKGKIEVKTDTSLAASTRVSVQSCGAVTGTYGAVVAKDLGTLHVESGTVRFADCFSAGTGGAITAEGAGTVVNLEGGPVTFERCSAVTNGGAVAVLSGAKIIAVSTAASSATSFRQCTGTSGHVYVCKIEISAITKSNIDRNLGNMYDCMTTYELRYTA
jgi:hypothetical protein